jgi:hypothetical protein
MYKLKNDTISLISLDMGHNALADAKAQAKRFAQISQRSKDLLVDYLFTSAGYQTNG